MQLTGGVSVFERVVIAYTGKRLTLRATVTVVKFTIALSIDIVNIVIGIVDTNTIATSIVNSKLDYCNSLYFNLPETQINRLQHTQNSLARTVANTPKYSHITPVLKSLHWLKIEQRIQYKLISLTYKILTTSQLYTYLHNLISLQTDNNTRSSDVVTLARPSPTSSLKVIDCSFK